MMKNKLLLTVAMASVAGIASAGTITTPYIAGEFQGWDPGATLMTETALGSDVWTYTVTGLTANQRQTFKITDGTWGTALPMSGDSWYLADNDGNITITYDGNLYADSWSPATDRIGVSYAPSTWNVTGDFWSELGGGDWDTSNGLGTMTAEGGGIYSVTINDLTDGSYIGKPVMSGSYDGIGADGRGVNSDNFGFTTAGDQNDVVFYVDALTGIAKVEVIPEPATLALIGLFGTSLLFARRRFSM